MGKWPQDLDPDHLLRGRGEATLVLRGSQGHWAHSGTGAWCGKGRERPGLRGAQPYPVGARKQGRGGQGAGDNISAAHSPRGHPYL